MQNKRISDLIASFDEQSSKVTLHLTGILDIVKEGRIPSENDMFTMNASMADLRTKYDDIYELAQEFVSADEFPEKGVAVTDIIEAVNNSQARYVFEQLERAKKILRKFVSIKSLVDEYAAALAPYQFAAANLLAKITAEDVAEGLDSQTEAPELFIEVMTAESIHSPAGIELMKRVQQHYPEMEITYGLIGKKYYFNSDDEETVLKHSVALNEVPIDDVATQIPRSVSVVQEKETPEATSTPIASQADNNTPYEPTEEAASVFHILNKVKTGVPSASNFKNAVDKMARRHPEVKAVLPLFTNLGVLAKSQIYMVGVCMDCFEDGDDKRNRVYAAVDILTEKGYLAKFMDDNGAEFYCLAEFGCICMHKESIKQAKNMFDISIGNVKLSANMEIQMADALLFLCCNDVLLDYLCNQRKSLAKSEYNKIKESIKWCGDHYRIAFFDEGQIRVAFLGSLLSNNLEDNATEIDATGIDEKYIIISRRNVDNVILFNDICEKVLVADAGRLHICNPKKNLVSQLNGTLIKTEESTNAVKESVAMDESAVLGFNQVSTLSAESVVSVEESQSGADTGVVPSPVETVSVQFPAVTHASVDGQSEAAGAELTPSSALELGRTPTDEEFCRLIHELLSDVVEEETLHTAITNAVLLAKGAGLVKDCPRSKQLSAQLRLATMLLLEECTYSSEFLATIFGNAELDVPVLTLAAYMYALLTPAEMYDYGLKIQTEQYLANFDNYFEELVPFKALFNKLLSVRDVKASGFTPAVIALLGNAAESEHFMKSLRREASANLTVNTPKTRMKALPIMYSATFGASSDFYQCMDIIANGKNDAESLDLIDAVLADYCDIDGGEYSINEDKIEERLNRAWDDANAKNKFKLEYDARDQALRQYRQRITIMVKWIEHIRTSTNSIKDIEHLKVLRKEILTQISDIRKDNSWLRIKDANVLKWLLVYMEKYLTGKVLYPEVYADLLYTGIFSLSENGIPMIDRSLADIKYYEVWRNALRHIVAPRKSAEDITAEILGRTLDGDAGLKDNLRQLSLLGEIIGSEDDIFDVSEEQVREAEDSANIRTELFKDELELAYTYYQINETEKENLVGIMNQYKSAFYKVRDFAAWRRFLEALELQIHEFADGRKNELRSRLDMHLAKDDHSKLLLEVEHLLEEASNFAVAEEYLNRYEAGERELDQTTLLDKEDYFSEFLTPSVYDPLLQECIRHKGGALKNYGVNYLEKHLPKSWTARLRDDSKALVSNWPGRKEAATPAQVQGLLQGLGIDVIKATKVTGKKEEMWQVQVQPVAKSRADYLHPIAAFGTQMKSPLQIIFLYGNFTPQQLVDTVTSMNLGTMSIVFTDQPIGIAERRLIGEVFHTQKTGQNSFLVVDQVLLLYLAMHQETERLPALLKCTLPYTTYQPFVRDGGSTADEMFCGRKLELATIIDPKGACVVYGGRQLGKTALLERAESRCSKPENKAYAVYTSIRYQNTEEAVVETLVNDINRKTGGQIALKSCKTLREVCSQLSEFFSKEKIVSMHLLIDEVDAFLGAIADVAYEPIQPLVDLKRETKNNFKFVIAGLHNVCRAQNATKNNGIFGQLGTPLCIKPLSPTDALQLLSRPLRYLGFQIDRYPHLETILTNTNYYPGILQFFGYILVETLTGQYSKYYHAADGNPPFTLQDEQLGAVMNSADLNKSIKDKFRWSLELDPRYFMIARCITMLYHLYEEDRLSGSWRGFSVNDVVEMAELFKIHCLESVSPKEYVVLMDEMVEMGILGKTGKESEFYRLRRNSFVDIIGESVENLEVEINNNNEEA